MYYFNFLFSFAGGKKFTPVITFLSVFASSSKQAFLATAPPCLLTFAFSVNPFAYSASAICRVESSARAVNTSSASLVWSRRFWFLRHSNTFLGVDFRLKFQLHL